jgi:hypothetical protein
MVTVRLAATALVVIVKVAIFWPAGMVSGETWADVLSLDTTLIVAPPIGAGFPSVTVPLTLLPPAMELALSVSCMGGSTESATEFVVWLRVAVRLGLSPHRKL